MMVMVLAIAMVMGMVMVLVLVLVLVLLLVMVTVMVTVMVMVTMMVMVVRVICTPPRRGREAREVGARAKTPSMCCNANPDQAMFQIQSRWIPTFT